MPSPADCSVVVVALAGGAALDGCLASLAPERTRCHVILAHGMGEAASWQARFPAVRFSFLPELTVPLRRERGIREAEREIVAVIEDTSHPVPGWSEALARAFDDPGVAAASGPVTIDPALPARAQALGCTEYARFHPRRFARLATSAADARGILPVARLPGNNLAYRRAAILEVLDASDHGLLESEVHPALLERGHVLAMHPGMAVTYRAADPRGLRVGTRFHHGRLYAGARAARWSFPRRLAWAAGSLALPLVLCARSLAAMTAALPPAAWVPAGSWICILETAWAAGEATGYLAGGGKSLGEWR